MTPSFLNSTNLAPKEAAKVHKSTLSKTQGYVLVCHGRSNVWCCLLSFKQDPQATQDLKNKLGAFGAKTTTALQLMKSREAYDAAKKAADEAGMRKAKSAVVSAAGISALGYKRLEVGAPENDQDSFWNGFHHQFREKFLNLEDRSLDAILILASDTESKLGAARKKIDDLFLPVATTKWEEGKSLKETGRPRDHFGYAEDISQPVFFKGDGGRNATWTSNWNPDTLFSIVLALQPDRASGDEFGSYMAFMKIEQHKDEFDRLVNETCLKTGASQDKVKSWIMGRNLDGTPLIGGPDLNDFDYKLLNAADCPRAAHIRKMNPRDDNDRRHRVLRRGVFYSEGNSKGALFQCFQSNLGSGFEYLLKNWALRDENGGQDPILGARLWPPLPNGVGPLPGAAPVERLTTVHFGEYFYFPSKPYFKRLAAAV